jgi:heme exporter protein A
MSLQAHRLSQARGDHTLFAELDFTLLPGEALWLQGGNGSGKTSLLRLLCGLAEPVAGEVRWNGTPIARQREHFFNQVAHGGHAIGVKDELLAWENVAFGAALTGQRCSREQAIDALDRLGLSTLATRPARALSQGQRKRVALARLFVAPQRPLLLLDEPFTALDTDALDTLRGLLDAHLASQGLLVFTTHQPVALRARRLQTLALAPDAVPSRP